jgi:zinc/manganese transport system substrate-binding protein
MPFSFCRRRVLGAAAVMFATVLSCGVNAAQAAEHPATAAKPVPNAIQIVAAENFYGALAQRIGGTQVVVHSILSNPEQDPHSFEASPKVARVLAKADLVIANGAAYDPWVSSLLDASPHAGRTVIVVADLIGKKVGDNPHLWYHPETMPAVAKALTQYLVARDPAHGALYQQRLTATLAQYQAIESTIAALRAKYHGVPVSATEPVFGYMAEAIGLDMQNMRFQIAVMNESEPSAADIAAFEQGLRSKAIKVLIYNAQTSDQLSRRMLSIARRAGVPVVPVTETEPAGQDYPQWMLAQLTALEQALAQSSH